MKQATFLLILILALSNTVTAQAPVYQIQGPHAEYDGPYHIRIFINYVQTPNNPWTQQVDLHARSAAIVNNLNEAYNKHNIYFIGAENTCVPYFQVITESNFSASHLHPYAIDIFDRGGDNLFGGWAFSVPSVYCEISGLLDGLPASQSTIMVHEIGHCLGLSHIFTGEGQGECLEATGSSCPDGEEHCFCCGDYVCDTPVAPDNITVSADCSQAISHPDLPVQAFRNYMAYTNRMRCLDRFTPGQVKRMWAYLALAPVLQAVRLPEIIYPASTPSGISGNIVVESGELVISSPLEMLPGATIRVKQGAKLVVASTITGACGQMWGGIIVEGDAFDPHQSPQLQGQVEVVNGGVIEHALCGINVQDVHAPASTGGGVVRLWLNSEIRNNIIGVRFGQYNFPNRSSIIGSIFSITKDYRGGEQRPTLLELNGIKGLSIRLTRFRDSRTQCPAASLRAIGIDSRNSGFRVSASSRFEGLYRGIRACKLTESNGSLYASGCTFERCYKGIELTSSGSFIINGNDFLVNNLASCPPVAALKGVEIRGKTTGFSLARNSFTGQNALFQTCIGTDCIGIGKGLANTVFKNSYTNLTVGNRASGDNGYEPDGLLYLCNSNNVNLGADFIILDGSIRKTQGIVISGGQPRAAGNVFSGSPLDFACTILNYGKPIDYYFFVGDPRQDPGTPGHPNNVCNITGFVKEPTNEPNSICADPEPCLPCPYPEVEVRKLRFLQKRQLWLEKTEAWPMLTDLEQQTAELSAILQLRIAMNEDASQILMHYSLDTVNVQTDSIVRWLALAQTYATDLRLARHYFFTRAFEPFDALWSQIPTKHSISEEEQEEWERLTSVYSVLRPLLEEGAFPDALPRALLDTLVTYTDLCDEAGFLAEVILRQNGVEEGPDCSEVANRSPLDQTEVQTPASRSIELNVYPNPAQDALRVEHLGDCSGGLLRLYDLQGRLRRECALPPVNGWVNIPIGDLSNGPYLIQWSCEGRTGQTKVIIAR
ncbi:MAG: zinc-dependent metalloprotease [Saprospiraceae bacterium]|nr:zinc-dependent metalloprotease [Saprospiraceae bacterium]MDW8484934.1 zinc-dependent metalloprotease [Saprospiraceae bacterium]